MGVGQGLGRGGVQGQVMPTAAVVRSSPPLVVQERLPTRRLVLSACASTVRAALLIARLLRLPLPPPRGPRLRGQHDSLMVAVQTQGRASLWHRYCCVVNLSLIACQRPALRASPLKCPLR